MDDYDYDSDVGKLFRETMKDVENYVELMVEDNEDLNEQDVADGNTKLHDAVKYLETPKMIIELAQAGADMNIKNENGDTPLHIAIKHRENAEIANALLKHGADINIKDFDEYTPLHLAIKHRTDTEIITALLKQGADVMARCNNGYSDEYTPLHLAAQHNENPDVIYILGQHRKSNIKRSDFVNARAEFGHTPMHRAAVSNKNPKVLIELRLLGADVNARNDSKSTPLHLAAEHGYPESILYLIALGADGTARDNEGYIPDSCIRENSNLYYDTRAKKALHKAGYPDSD